MKKNALRIGLAFLVLALSLGAYKIYTDSKLDQGSKSIQIVIQDDKQFVLFDKTVKTDAETLGDLLDEMIADQRLSIVYSGNKTDLYGRFITKINELESKEAGPWWVYASTTNAECIAAGYCGGIDMNPIHDKDIFTFSLSMGY